MAVHLMESSRKLTLDCLESLISSIFLEIKEKRLSCFPEPHNEYSNRIDKPFMQTILMEALKPDENEKEKFVTFKETVESNADGYPTRPLFKRLAQNLARFLVTRDISNCSKPQVDAGSNTLGLNVRQHDFTKNMTSLIEDVLDCIHSNSFHDDKDAQNQASELIGELILEYRKSDVLFLLGLGRTEGSLDLLPPDLYTLWQSFQYLNNTKSTLTVGARALTKHSHRSSEQFWGVCTGKESAKNNHALDVLQKIFVDCDWINIHTLPHQVYVLEIRCSQGYGLRWNSDGTFFRGFLEPQMENGHEISWRH